MIEHQYAKIYYFYTKALARSVRLILLFLLTASIFYSFSIDNTPKLELFLLTFFLMVETFFAFKVTRLKPGLTVEKTTKENRGRAFTAVLLYAFIAKKNSQDFLSDLFRLEQVRYLFQKIGVESEKVELQEVDIETLIEKAAELVLSLKGSYITSVDIAAAYLLLTEEKSKILFTNHIKQEDIPHILHWTRGLYKNEEHPPQIKLDFDGGGIGESLVAGWTPETENYTRDVTYDAVKEKPVILGRTEEFTRLVEALRKSINNNVVLVGEDGSGKEHLIKAFGYKSYTNDLGRPLDGKYVWELMLGPLIAGMEGRGELETRLQSVVQELSHAGNVILFIPNLQNILGASSYDIDLSGALLPYLRKGTLPIVATLTPGNYKAFLENNPLKEVFEVIKLEEPSVENALQMIMRRTSELEEKYKVIISFGAVRQAVLLANRFMTDSALPGNAIALLEEVANETSNSSAEYFGKTSKKFVSEDFVVKKVEIESHIPLSNPTDQEKDRLLHLEEELHKRVINQNQAITSIAEAVRRIRTNMESTEKPISFLFLGPTGVGKTETAKALAAVYFGGEERMIRLDMSEYTSEDGVRRLLGGLPGESSERGELTDKVHDNPASLILLDEFEKAHPTILNLFLQVLEDGRLTDNRGKTVSFINTIIIATSNAGSEFIRESVKNGIGDSKQFHKSLLEHLQSKNIFKPELLNRFDEVITFTLLGKQEVGQIARLLLNSVEKTLDGQDIKLSFDDAAVGKIALEGADEQFGARPIRRYIQDNIEDLIAKKKLTNELQRGANVIISVDESGNFILKTV